MKISLNDTLNKLIWLLTVFLFATFLIFDTYTWGRYAFFGSSVLILLLSAFANGGKLSLRMCPYYGFFAVFTVYVGVTSLWAWDSGAAVTKATTLVQILGCSAMVYIHYDRQDNVRELLSAVKWAGFIVAVYAIFFYGIENLGLEEGDRLDNEFANINGIGMAAALACVLQVHELLYKRSRWSAIMMIPAVVMIAATQSRKALVFLVVGVFGVLILRSLAQKGNIRKLLKAIVSVAAVCVVFYLVLQLPMFGGILSRMESMVASWTGEGASDSSADKRNELVKLGWEYFLQYPLGGSGFGSSGIITQRHLGWSTYLHNNYVELLSGGGIIGFVLYYLMHAYLLMQLIKNRKADPEAFVVGTVWLGLILIMHWGMVAYYTKSDWYYLMTMFLLVEGLKKKGRVKTHESKEAA